jgi:hypothetical protein
MNIFTFISLLLSGGVVNLARFCSDPYLWAQVKKMLLCRGEGPKAAIKKEEEEKTKDDNNNDIWNLPLAQAVTVYHNQSIISNIIAIVLHTCVNTIEENAIKNSDFLREPANYHFGSFVNGFK